MTLAQQTARAPRRVGPKSMAVLEKVGIRTLAELKKVGAVPAYVRAKRADRTVTLNFLYGW